MLIIIDKRMPLEAKSALSEYGELMEFSTSGITYDAISGHPDIFFCRVGARIAAAPDIPAEYTDLLKKRNISIVHGKRPVGGKYPASAGYNAAVWGNFLVHRLDITDPSILMMTEDMEKINIMQGYTRCSLLPLENNLFITSDMGIHSALQKRGRSLYVSPYNIILPGFAHGFFGGACGVHDDKIFVTGNLDYLSEGNEVRVFLKDSGYTVIELYNGPLFDCGSILFI